jgi:hypothetical protein
MNLQQKLDPVFFCLLKFLNNYSTFVRQLIKIIQAIENDEELTAKVSMYRGFLEAFRGKNEEAKKYYAQARAADPDIDRQYLGLQLGSPVALLDLVSTVNFLLLFKPNPLFANTWLTCSIQRSYGAPEENHALRDFLFYKELAPISMGNYALLDPGVSIRSRNSLIEHRLIQVNYRPKTFSSPTVT